MAIKRKNIVNSRIEAWTLEFPTRDMALVIGLC